MTQLISDREMQFQLYEVLDTEALLARPRFADHNRETFDATLDTANKIATEKFADHNSTIDQYEPEFVDGKVQMREEVQVAWDAYSEAGLMAGRYDFDEGGMQLPETIYMACNGYFMAANPSTAGYPFLTVAAANVIKHFADDELKDAFLPPMLEGQFSGTMALTEPHAGSSLADIRSKATPTDAGHYLIKGSKLYISGGEHELTDNIVHLVLAKIEGAPDGVKGISLFLVPKFRADETGALKQRNDIALAGLIHKLGYRGTTSTALTFGEKDDCHGYLVGEPHHGLKYMFLMMNEARIGVGFGAAMIGYRGYQLSLEYAKDRHQGRKPSQTKPSDPTVPIIEHGDVKRMLLAQKAYSEGAISLCLYAARLVDDTQTLAEDSDRQKAAQLLDLLTPVVKSWSAEYGVKANDLAIQVLGGAGYTREYPVEQCWRDNRLNPIHEGTNGIQALDLLTRKLWQANGVGLSLLSERIAQDISKALPPKTSKLVRRLQPYLARLQTLIPVLAQSLRDERVDATLANAQSAMTVFGHIIMSWMWIRQASAAERALTESATTQTDFYAGKLQTAQYFIHCELPLIEKDLMLLSEADDSCSTMQTDWF